MSWVACSVALVVSLTPALANGENGEPVPAKVDCVGDYSTADFRQWAVVQNQAYEGPGADYSPTYSASIVKDDTHGTAARFELRSGDVPPFGGAERTEVMAERQASDMEGQVWWYEFSTKFDTTFPRNHADLGWGVTNQFWGASGASPPLAWSVGQRNGYWSLLVEQQSSPGSSVRGFSIFDTPLAAGTWHDVTMQIRWSASDDVGWVRLWLNGKRQTFIDGSDTYHVRTLIPGTRAITYKEGYYRHRAPKTPTGVVYHTGFRCGTDNPPLG